MTSKNATALGMSAAAGLLFGLPALAIGPAGDDWFDAHPMYAFPWSYIMPHGRYWRPLWGMVCWIAGFAKERPIDVYHLAAVLGHVLSLVLLCILLLEHVRLGRLATLVIVGLVAVHPANAAAVWSVDTCHQTWSTAFGLWACLLALRGRQAVWLVPATISVLWKESGLAWFAAVPLLRLFLTRDAGSRLADQFGRERRWLLIGLLGGVTYLAVRMLLAGQVSLGDREGRYAFTPSPLIWLKNSVMLLGVALTPVDTVKILGLEHKLLRGVAPVLLALPAGILVVAGLWRKPRVPPLSIAFGSAFILAVMAPHIFISHVSELYAHPVTFALALVGAVLLVPRLSPTQFTRLALAGAFLAFFVVDVSKYTTMLATARSAEPFAESTNTLLGDSKGSAVCFVPDDQDQSVGGYSVFQMDVASASGWGKALVLKWGWNNYDAISVEYPSAPCPEQALRFHMSRDGALRPFGGSPRQ